MKPKNRAEERRQGTRVWLRRLRVMTVKELLQFSRDIVLVLFFLYAFTLDVYLAGSGVSLSLRKAPMVVRDRDRSLSSREIVSRFRPPYFDVRAEVEDAGEAVRLLDSGEAVLFLSIPPRFEESMRKGRPTALQLQVDTTNSVLGNLASSYSARIVGDYGLEVALDGMKIRRNLLPWVSSEVRVWYNRNQKDTWFMSIMEMLTMVTLFAILLPAAAMVREKEKGTLEQLLVSPLNPLQILLPKILSMTVVILAGTSLCVFGVLRPLFDVPMRGSLLLFLSLTVLFVFATAGLGLLISTIARNLGQASLLTILVFGPMIFLSGAWTPPEAMPAPMRVLLFLSPLHHYINVSLGILLKGAGSRLLWDSLLAMAIVGGVLFGLALWRLRRQFR